jgi:putative transposase
MMVGQTFLSVHNQKTNNPKLFTLSEPQLQITRRHLPHWTLEDSTYFITSRVAGQVLSTSEQILVKDHIKKGHRIYYSLCAVIVMPDHAHIILKPKHGTGLYRIMKGIKGVSANLVNKSRGTRGSIWQDESFDRIIRDYDELLEKLNYMMYNPVKKDLTNDPWNYHGWFLNEEFLNGDE